MTGTMLVGGLCQGIRLFLTHSLTTLVIICICGCGRSGPLNSGRIDCGDGVRAEVAFSSFCAYLPQNAPTECPELQPTRVPFGGVLFCTDNPSPSNTELGAALTMVVAPEEPLVGDIMNPGAIGGDDNQTGAVAIEIGDFDDQPELVDAAIGNEGSMVEGETSDAESDETLTD